MSSNLYVGIAVVVGLAYVYKNQKPKAVRNVGDIVSGNTLIEKKLGVMNSGGIGKNPSAYSEFVQQWDADTMVMPRDS